MDYFSELLESYAKLKKRTFKLTYLEEEDKKKEEGKISVNQNQQGDGAALAQQFMQANLQDIQKGTAFAPWRSETDAGVPIDFWIGPSSRKQPLEGEGPGELPGAQATEVGGEVIKAKSGESFGEVGIIHGKAVTLSGKITSNPEKFQLFVGKFVADADTGAADTAAKAEAERQAQEAELLKQRLDTIGSLIDSDPERFPELAKFIVTLQTKNHLQMDELCDKGRLPVHICKGDLNTLQYIGGSNAKSLESKLFNGTGFIGFDEKGKMVREQIGEGVFADVFQTNLELLKLLERGEPDCDEVNKRMGLVGKGKVVLFTDPDQAGPMKLGEGGVVMEKGGLHQAMIKIFEDSGCKIKPYKFKGSTNSLNETKGRFNEGFMGLITRVFSEVSSWTGQSLTGKQKKGKLKPIIDEFEDDVQDTLDSLQEFAGQTPMSEEAIVLQSYPLMKEIESELESLTTRGKVKNLIEQMYVQMGGLLKTIAADDIIAGGTAQRLGGKVDNFFMYLGPDGLARAQAAADHLTLKPHDVVVKTPAELYEGATEALKPQIKKTLKRQGLSVTNTTTQLHLLSAGNKLSVGNEIKFGDLSLNRATDIVMGNPITGPSQPADEDAWYAKLDASLGFTDAETGRIPNPVLEQPETIPNPDAPEEFIPNPDYDPTAPATVRGENEGSIATYFSSIQKLYNSCNTISQQAQYTNNKGNISLTNPSQRALQLQGVALGRFKYGTKGSNFYNACTKEIPNPNGDDPKTIRERKLLEGNTPEAVENRKKASEALKRDYLSYRFRTDYNGKDPVKREGATDALCRMAGATIMEQTEMGQIVTMEGTDEEPLVVNQNDILRGMGEARRNGTLDIVFSGSTQHFNFEVNGQMITYSTNFERQKGRPAMSGSISKENAAKVGKTVEPLGPQVTKEDTFYQFLQGQMNLLENILNQTKHTQSL